MKIVVVSLVANSADIIESFVRHSLTFADEMIIVDHQSADDTVPILKKLKEEGLPIHLDEFDKAELPHGEIMTELSWRAVNELNADMVLPFDSDEFLISTVSGKTCREILEELRLDRIYEIHHWLYAFAKPDTDRDKFTLSRPAYRKPTDTPKTFITRNFMKHNPDFRFAQGTHYVFDTNYTTTKFPTTKLTESLHLAHYQWRSVEQVVSKVVDGWITNVAKYSRYTINCAYWGNHFREVLKGKVPELLPKNFEDSFEFADLNEYSGEAETKYTSSSAADPLKNLMVVAEKLAQAYIEEKTLSSSPLISANLPFWGDEEKFKKSFQSLLNQDVPRLEIAVWTSRQINSLDVDLPKEWVVKQCAFSDSNGMLPFGEKVREQNSGEYILWLLPGDELKETFLRKAVVSMETNNNSSVFIADNENKIANDLRIRLGDYIKAEEGELSVWNGSIFADNLLKEGKIPSGGFSGMIFCRELLNTIDWLEGYETPGNFFELTAILELVRRADWLSVSKELFVNVDDERDNNEKYIWQHIECFLQVSAQKDTIAYKKWQERNVNLKKYSDKLAQIPVWKQYLSICENQIG